MDRLGSGNVQGKAFRSQPRTRVHQPGDKQDELLFTDIYGPYALCQCLELQVPVHGITYVRGGSLVLVGGRRTAPATVEFKGQCSAPSRKHVLVVEEAAVS